jgi:probable DNA repair protein
VDLRATIRAAASLETVEDGHAPAPALDGVRPGGTGLFRDQAACPFRAVARHRLGSRPPEAPAHGLDPRARGSLVHAMLDAVWERVGNSEALAALDEAALERLLGECADATLAAERGHRAEVLAGRFGELERARLARLAGEWLRMERARAPFSVVAREEKKPVTFGGVTVHAKLDRMDALASGGLAIIDYKTGMCRTGEWMGPRPDEPQLPMYARAAGDEVAAVAFGVVRAGAMGFKGIGREADILPGVRLVEEDKSRLARHHADWKHLVRSWSEQLEILGTEFASGEARTDPKWGSATCGRCEQQVFCRVAEKAPYLSGKGGQPDE